MSEPTHFPEAENWSLPKEIQAQTNGTLYCKTEQTPFANPIFFSTFALVLFFA
jgi:predicted FMN-binding regulatory protein PaiB